MVGAELVPGLHNELAMEVLLRMPEEYHFVAMEASSLWRIVLCSDRFHALWRLRLKPGRPALLLLLRRGKYDNTHDLFKLNLAAILSKPRRLISSRKWHLSRFEWYDFRIDTLACLRKNSLLALNRESHDGWMKFDISSRKWTRFGQPGPLPCDFQADHVKLLGVLDTRVFVSAYNRNFRVALSYDYSIDRWDSHEGLPHNFLIERLRFTFRGQIFIRLNEQPVRPVYAFDPVTNRWKEHELMTKRLAMVPMWSRVAATHDGTLISAWQRTPNSIWEGPIWKIEVKEQDEGSFEWCNLLEVLVESPVCIDYFLFIEENHIFLVTEDEKGTKKMCTREDHVLGQRRLTCVYVPEFSLMGAVLIHV